MRQQCLDNQIDRQPKMSLPFCHPNFFPVQLWDPSQYQVQNARVNRRTVIPYSKGCNGLPSQPHPCSHRTAAHYCCSPIQHSAGRHPEGSITVSLFFVCCLDIFLDKEIMACRIQTCVFSLENYLLFFSPSLALVLIRYLSPLPVIPFHPVPLLSAPVFLFPRKK